MMTIMRASEREEQKNSVSEDEKIKGNGERERKKVDEAGERENRDLIIES